jgi:hypothetical protein
MSNPHRHQVVCRLTFRRMRTVVKHPPLLSLSYFNAYLSAFPNVHARRPASLRSDASSFEGHPENVGEYIPASVGEMAGGVKDMAHGAIARGGHRMISGAQNAMLPALPFVAAAAPGAVLRGAVGGYVGSKAAGTGAEMLGATPDQTD